MSSISRQLRFVASKKCGQKVAFALIHPQLAAVAPPLTPARAPLSQPAPALRLHSFAVMSGRVAHDPFEHHTQVFHVLKTGEFRNLL